jgi:O-antigen ligase/polysaccharide polymerase Wzy-like membrane protein
MRRTGRAAAVAALVACSLLCSAGYIGQNARISARVPHGGWREMPLLALLWLGAALCVLQWRFVRAAVDAPSRSSVTLRALLCVASVCWLGGVCASSLTVHGECPFFWGAMAPYGLAATACLATRLVKPTFADLMVVSTCASLVVAATIILDAAGTWGDVGTLASMRRPHGLFYNRNYAGEYLALSLPFFVPLLSRPRARWLLVPLALALVWTRCRTAWITASVASICLLLLCARQYRKQVALGLAVFAVAMLAAAVVPTRLQWREAQPYRATVARLLDVRSGSGAVRVRQYLETFDLVVRRAGWGLGPGRWREEIARRDQTLAINHNPHSDFLRALADGGVVSLAGLLALFIGASIAARRAGPSALAFVVAFAITAIADCPLYRIETLTLAAVVLAVITSETRRVSRPAVVDHEGLRQPAEALGRDGRAGKHLA